ncbi:peptidase dimerization domain-containing protein [Pseudorhodoferax sp.]|uniref:peptidase dimerization domain-containing protein n=1 Tax=Pseudorhodoferax sp. TaxID=1993553 RepID=UPI0039E68A5F
MNKTIGSLLCLAALGLAGLPAAAEPNPPSLLVEFQGPGGHSNGNYGRTSALHAAGRAVVQLKQLLPAGSYAVRGLGGGNSVNSIASDGRFEVTLTAADATAYNALAAQVAAAAKAGADAENAFRNVREGDLTAGAPATIRYTVTPR